MLLELPGVREPAAALAAGVQLDARVRLHVGLELVGLAEAPAAGRALVRPLVRVHAQVPLVVLRRAEGLAAALAGVRLVPGVEALVEEQLAPQVEGPGALGAGVRPLPAVLPQVVQVLVLEVEAALADGAAELLLRVVALLMGLQGACAAEGLDTHRAAEPAPRRAHLPSPASATTAAAAAVLRWALVRHLLVLQQLTVVEEGLPTEVAHEGHGGSVDQRVFLQPPGA